MMAGKSGLAQTGLPPAPDGASYGLDDAACHAVLRDVGWGVLSVVEQDADSGTWPYAVPVAYAFDGEELYVATRPGRKLRGLERHPLFCLTVLDIERFDRWRSVIVTGKPVWMSGASERAVVIQAFAGQRRPGGMRLTRRDTARLLGARILRIDVLDMSGRACGSWPDVPGEPSARASGAAGPRLANLTMLAETSTDEASAVMDDIRRIVRAIHSASSQSQRDHGVSAAQLFVMRQVAASPGQSMSDLAGRTRTTQSSVSEVVSRLVRRGLIERQPASDDRRRAVLTLTPAGRDILRRAPDTIQERLLDGFGRLPPDQQTQLAQNLASWLGESGLRDVPATMFLEPPDDRDGG